MKIRKISYLLINKSEDAFLLALEIFNKPTVEYRLESFAIFFTNAWELLLKAKLIEDSKKSSVIFEKKIRNKPKKTISLDQAINRVFPNENNPVRNNIVDISDVRNFSVHYIVPEMEYIYGGLFQQGVLNYNEYLMKWFGKELSIKPRMLTLVFDFQPENVDLITIKKKYSKDILNFYENIQDKIMNNIPRFKGEYCIPINLKLAFVKNPKKSDIVLNQGRTGISGIPIEVPKDPSKTHPYLTKKFIKEVVKTGANFNSHSLKAINKIEKINSQTRPDFVYKSSIYNGLSNQYSEEYKKYILDKIAIPGYIEMVRKKYKNYLKKQNNAHKNK